MSTIQSSKDLQIRCCLFPQQPSSRFLLSDIRFLSLRVATTSAGTKHRLRCFMSKIVVIFLKNNISVSASSSRTMSCDSVVITWGVNAIKVFYVMTLLSNGQKTRPHACLQTFCCNKCYFFSLRVSIRQIFLFAISICAISHREGNAPTHTQTHTHKPLPACWGEKFPLTLPTLCS